MTKMANCNPTLGRIILAVLITLLTWPADSVQAKAELENPFTGSVEFKNAIVIYEITGRFEGQEILWLNGADSIRERKVVDKIFGFRRPVHIIESVAGDRVTTIDRIAQTIRVSPNIRARLGRLWNGLTETEKSILARNLDQLRHQIGFGLFDGKPQVGEPYVLGIKSIEVSAKGSKMQAMARSKVVLGQSAGYGESAWLKAAVDMIVAPNAGSPKPPKTNWPRYRLIKAPPGEDAWTDDLCGLIIELLRKPLVSYPLDPDKLPGLSGMTNLGYEAPWPAATPPDFREKVDQLRVNPGWRPFPLPPGFRTWPPVGLSADILTYRSLKLINLITARRSWEDPRSPVLQPSAIQP